jgi:diacylglycerol kinase family enzyme
MGARRSAALASLALAVGGLVLGVVVAIEQFPRGVVVLLLLWIGLWAGWLAVRRAGLVRLLAAAIVSAALTAAILLVVLDGRLGLDSLVIAAWILSILLARAAFRAPVVLLRAPRPRQPVLFFNPASGGGKARRFHLEEEARSRGIAPVELHRGDDLRELVAREIDAGADALAMAGGDGSQAIVAELAARHGLPYACIPAGTRNHFALDLGVDREDVVGALEALVDGGERRVDLAEVNGRVFVNNVSLGFYADAVERDGYREAKLRTVLAIAPVEVGSGPDSSISWEGPEGDGGSDGMALLVSNDPYRLGTVIGSGTRPRLDAGVLGIAAVSTATGRRLAPVGLRLTQWSRPSFAVSAEGPVAAGIDGEAVTLSPPIEFVSRPHVLRVRIARGHPGASPSARVPHGLPAMVVALARIAVGRDDAVAQRPMKTRERSSDGHLRGGTTRDPDPR